MGGAYSMSRMGYEFNPEDKSPDSRQLPFYVLSSIRIALRVSFSQAFADISSPLRLYI